MLMIAVISLYDARKLSIQHNFKGGDNLCRSGKEYLNALTCIDVKDVFLCFLRATAGTAIARLSHRNSVCLSVRPSVRLSVCHTGG